MSKQTDAAAQEQNLQRGLAADTGLQIVGGARDALFNLSVLGNQLNESLGINDAGRLVLESLDPESRRFLEGINQIPEVPEAETLPGQIARPVSQFSVGFFPLLRAFRTAGMAPFAASEAAAITSEQALFSPFDYRMSNLIQQFPALQNPVTEFLAADSDSSEAVERMKLAIEGAGLGVLVPAVTSLVKAGWRAKKQALEEIAEESVAAQHRTLKSEELEELRGFAGNINLDHIDAPESTRAVIQDAATVMDEFVEARRGVHPLEHTERLASDLGMTVDDLMERRQGQAFNAEQALASRMLMVKSADDVVAKANAAVGGSDEAIVAFQEALLRHTSIQEQVAGMTAEAGRALSQFRIDASADRTKALKAIIDANGGRGQIEDVAELAATLQTPEGVAKFTRNATKSTTGEKLVEIWINSLLSGPQTQAVNILSNAVTAGWTIPEQAIAAGFSKIRGAKPGEGVAARETVSKAFGLVQGMKDGLRLAARTFMTEQPSSVLTKIETANQQAVPSITLREGAEKVKLFNTVPVPFTGEIQLGGKQVRIPGRLLQAADEFYKSMAYRMELNALGMRSGLKKGLKGAELAEHIQGVIENPPDSLRRAAIDAGHYQTFTKELGEIGKTFQRARSSHPIFSLIAPFIRTPVNILKFAGERTPLSVFSPKVRKLLMEKSPAGDLQRARLTLGSMTGATIASLAAEGVITGGGPTDPEARAAKYREDWQPYSIKIGDTWHAYSRIEPLGILFGVAADYAEIAGQIEEKEADKIGAAMIASISRNLTSKTWLRGVSDLVQAYTDPGRYGESYIQSMAGTLIPTGVAQVARTMDPELKEARSIIDKLKSRIPGYSADIPARLNLWGEPVVLEGGVGPDIISPIYTKKITPDAVSTEMARLEMTPGMPNRKLGELDLSDQQYRDLVKMAGRRAKMNLDQLVMRDSYLSLPDFMKKEVIKNTIGSARDEARAFLRSEMSQDELIQRQLGEEQFESFMEMRERRRQRAIERSAGRIQ